MKKLIFVVCTLILGSATLFAQKPANPPVNSSKITIIKTADGSCWQWATVPDRNSTEDCARKWAWFKIQCPEFDTPKPEQQPTTPAVVNNAMVEGIGFANAGVVVEAGGMLNQVINYDTCCNEEPRKRDTLWVIEKRQEAPLTPIIKEAPSIWTLRPELRMVSGFTSNRVDFGNFNNGFGVGLKLQRTQSNGRFHFFKLEAVTFPNQLLRDASCTGCDLAQLKTIAGLQPSFGTGYTTEKWDMYAEVRLPAMWPTDDAVIHPTPDNGVFVGANWKPVDFVDIGVKTGGYAYPTNGNWTGQLGLFAQAVVRPPAAMFNREARAIEQMRRDTLQKIRMDEQRTEDSLRVANFVRTTSIVSIDSLALDTTALDKPTTKKVWIFSVRNKKQELAYDYNLAKLDVLEKTLKANQVLGQVRQDPTTWTELKKALRELDTAKYELHQLHRKVERKDRKAEKGNS